MIQSLIEQKEILPQNNYLAIRAFPTVDDQDFLQQVCTQLGELYGSHYEEPFEPHITLFLGPRPDNPKVKAQLLLAKNSATVFRSKISGVRIPNGAEKRTLALDMEVGRKPVKLRQLFYEQNTFFEDGRDLSKCHMTLVNKVMHPHEVASLGLEEFACKQWSQRVSTAMGGTITFDKIEAWAVPAVTKCTDDLKNWQKIFAPVTLNSPNIRRSMNFSIIKKTDSIQIHPSHPELGQERVS